MLDLPPPDPAIEIAIASRGISKGLAQTEGAQVVVRPEVSFGPVFVGAYAKNVTSPTSDGEAGPVLGLRGDAAGFELSASAAWKLAVAPAAGTDDRALELAGSVSRGLGSLTPRLALTWSPDDLGGTGRSLFAEGALAWRAGKTTISAAFARRERDGGPDYAAFNAGLSHRLAGRFTLDLRWYDTDRSALGDPFRARLVGSLRARF